ncbi:MAG: hypothetical protein M1820_009367 [Bogoriella megaspora]|nr:MAG: hypothetical protein M1820_009367 [Bogoriella megaspora]
MAPTLANRLQDGGGANVSEEEVTVLVTGFGPFRRLNYNPSYDITVTLPQYLPATPSCPTKIKLMLYPSPIKVAYGTVIDIVPRLYSPPTEIPITDPSLPAPDPKTPPFDLAIHIGMAPGRSYYTLETMGHRDGYNQWDDVDGQKLPKDFGRKHWPGCPEILHTSLDTVDVWRRWKANLLPLGSGDKEIDVRPSDDAGHFLCDFIYYSSLAWYFRLGGRNIESERPALFLHVPGNHDEEALARGREVTIALIRAMVESRRMSKQ